MKEVLIWAMLLHGSAAYDGYQTNVSYRQLPRAPMEAVEANPIYRPFVGRPSMHAAIQIDAGIATGLLLLTRDKGPKWRWLARAFAGGTIAMHLRAAERQRRHRPGWKVWEPYWPGAGRFGPHWTPADIEPPPLSQPVRGDASQ